MTIWILAVAGSALVLTQSSLTAPLREWLDSASRQAALTRELRNSYEQERRAHPDTPPIRSIPFTRAWSHVSSALAKLASCPMCSGFWLGMGWAWYLVNRGALPGFVGMAFAYGFAGSIVSALAVAMWLALGEACAALGLWRFLKTPPPPDP